MPDNLEGVLLEISLITSMYYITYCPAGCWIFNKNNGSIKIKFTVAGYKALRNVKILLYFLFLSLDNIIKPYFLKTENMILAEYSMTSKETLKFT